MEIFFLHEIQCAFPPFFFPYPSPVSCLPPSLQLISSFASQEQKEYASAGAVAEEVLSSIRTVVSFGGENREAQR